MKKLCRIEIVLLFSEYFPFFPMQSSFHLVVITMSTAGTPKTVKCSIVHFIIITTIFTPVESLCCSQVDQKLYLWFVEPIEDLFNTMVLLSEPVRTCTVYLCSMLTISFEPCQRKSMIQFTCMKDIVNLSTDMDVDDQTWRPLPNILASMTYSNVMLVVNDYEAYLAGGTDYSYIFSFDQESKTFKRLGLRLNVVGAHRVRYQTLKVNIDEEHLKTLVTWFANTFQNG